MARTDKARLLLKTSNMPVFFDVKITTSIYCMCNFTITTCGTWSLVTDLVK